MEDPATPTPATAVGSETAKRIGQFIALRDKIEAREKEFKESQKPFRDVLEKLEARLTELLNQSGGDTLSVRDVGTVYRTTDDSATVGDKEAFRKFLEESVDLDMVNLTANKVSVRNYVEKNGEPPPGVNFTRRSKLGVRRPT